MCVCIVGIFHVHTLLSVKCIYVINVLVDLVDLNASPILNLLLNLLFSFFNSLLVCRCLKKIVQVEPKNRATLTFIFSCSSSRVTTVA